MEDTINVEKERKNFAYLENKVHGHPLIYFDNAATVQKPAIVIDTLCKFYKHEYASINRAVYEMAIRATKRTEEVRQKIAYFINAKSEDEIVFVKGTTEGINLIAYSYGDKFINEGDEIVSVDSRYYRPTEVDLLIGDASKAMKILNWKASTDLSNLVKIMVNADLISAIEENY